MPRASEPTPEQIAKVREVLDDHELLALLLETMEQEARDESDAMHAWAADEWGLREDFDEHPYGCECDRCYEPRCGCRFCCCFETVEIDGQTCSDCINGAHQG